jgi:large subunit ribosomal protein L16
MFEMTGVTADIAKEALRLAAHKLPVKTRIIVKGEM